MKLVCLCVLVDTIYIASLPGFTVPVIFSISALVYLIWNFYIPSCNRLELLEKEAKQSLIRYNSDMAKGVEQIRASQQYLTAVSRALNLLDKSQVPLYHHLDARRWAVSIVTFFNDTAIIAVAALACLQIADAATIGLAFFIIQSSGMNILITVEWMFRLISLQPSLTYLLDFIKSTPVEAVIPSAKEAPLWPKEGSIQLRNVTSRYK